MIKVSEFPVNLDFNGTTPMVEERHALVSTTSIYLHSDEVK